MPNNNTSRATAWLIHIFILSCIILGCIWTTQKYTVDAESKERQHLASLGQSIAAGLAQDDLSFLSGNDQDLDKEAYKQLQQKFVRLADVNQDVYYIYLLGEKDGQTVFYIDSQASQPDRHPEAANIAAVGELYPDPFNYIPQVIFNNGPVVTNPQQDSWGSYASALIALPAKPNNKNNLILGLDVATKSWRQKIFLDSILSYLLGLAALAYYVLTFMLPMRHKKNSKKAKGKRLIKKWQRLSLLAAALIVSTAIVMIIAYLSYAQENRRHLELIQTIMILTNTEDLGSLQGAFDDMKKLAYQHLDSLYTEINNANPSTRFVYLVGRDEGKIFFYVDSQPKKFKKIIESSYPGDVFTGPTDFINKAYSDDKSIITGPYFSQWGILISALTPVKNPDGNIKAVLGMDFDLNGWLNDIGLARVVIFLILMIGIALNLLKRNFETSTNDDLSKNYYIIKRFPY